MVSNVAPETVSSRLAGFSEEDRSWIAGILDDPSNDDAVLDGLHRFLDEAAGAPFLNALKLEKAGAWLGGNAPGRLQIRLMEAARSAHHPAHDSFRTGLVRSGGLAGAYPKSAV